VEWLGLELEQSVPQAAIAHQLLHQWSAPIPHLLQQLGETGQVQSDRFHATLLIGDARQTVRAVQQAGFRADAIFLDPFSPPRCPQLWTVEFVDQLAQCLKPDGRLATYSCAASVRAALRVNQFHISSTDGVGRRSPGTLATLEPDALPPLSQREWEHLQTRAAVPYRDPTLSDTAAAIQERHRHEQSICNLEPTSQWKKRWRAIPQAN
jgi:tRNA U34 5-methylaminomethyl-2-thiouridine-forming methyltransferase MnmC